MAAQRNPPSFGYTCGFADNSRADSVVEISPNINYTVSEAISDAEEVGNKFDLIKEGVCQTLSEYKQKLELKAQQLLGLKGALGKEVTQRQSLEQKVKELTGQVESASKEKEEIKEELQQSKYDVKRLQEELNLKELEKNDLNKKYQKLLKEDEEDYDADDEKESGYSPELQSTQSNHLADNENWNSLARNVLTNYDPNSQFHVKYKFASHRPLGTGKSSVCMKCFNPSNDNYYAVKIYKRGDQNDYEIAFLQKSSEESVPGVIYLVEVLYDSEWTYLVMELIDGVNLLEYFSTIALTGKLLYEFVDCLWKIMGQIHEHAYTHGHICFKKIFYLEQSQELRLLGFCNAKPITRVQDKRIDYWSLGVCIYTILCGHSPFNLSTIDPTVVAKRIEDNKFDEDSKQWAALRRDVKCYIQQLLHNSPSAHKSGALKKVKHIHAVDASKEQLDENEKIVKIRASRMETKPKNKPEGFSEINGNMPPEIPDSVMKVDASDVDQDQFIKRSLCESQYSELNGHTQNPKRKKI